MKKIFLSLTVLLASVMTLSAQTVRLNVDPDYDIYIDDRQYNDNAIITDLADGQHRVEVYKKSGGFLGIGRKKSLVNTGSFRLRNNDVLIETDENGRLNIHQLRNNNIEDRDGNGRMNDRDDNYGKTKKGRGYGPYDNPGKGNKYGLYKDKKNKMKDKERKYKDREDDDDD